MEKVLKSGILKMPGALDVRQKHGFQLISGSSSTIAELESGSFQSKHAKALYVFLHTVLPSGIFMKFTLLILKGDIDCNNYIAEKLNISRKEIKIKYNGRLHD